ncbi:translocation/assembly module TamB [Buchnera aphidicola]|uniref:translocation/assembly module TamB n=1 Tax=Buchnera aphidicola TaxID=9 RepID=UPI003463A8D5
MSIYQKYLSKSLIFVFSLFFLILFFLETSIGFKYFFNFANYFFMGLKVEKISGNWRNFTLKKINYKILGGSIKAENIHIITNPVSFFNTPIIFKNIETKKLVISLEKNPKLILKNNSFEKIKLNKKFFFQNSIIFRNIYFDKISLKIQKKNIFLFNVLSSITLNRNTLTIFPTSVNLVRSNLIYNKTKNDIDKKNFFYTNKINNFLSFFSNYKEFLPTLDIKLINLKCNQLKFFDQKNLIFHKIELSARFKKNILKIKNMKAFSKFIKIKSKGKIFFRDNFSTFFIINNKVSTNLYKDKVIKVLFKGTLNKKFVFTLKSSNLLKFNIYGKILLDYLDYPMCINLHIDDLFFPINKNLILSSKNFNLILKGKFNNYFLSLKNIFTISGMPSIFMHISAIGNLKNIFLKKINFFPFLKNIQKKKNLPQKKVKYSEYISQLAGKINLLLNSNKKYKNISFPHFCFKGDIIRKKISLSGSLYYQNINGIKIPRINFILGKNKGFLLGSVSNKVNIYSSFNFNHLEYFLPNLKGIIKSTLNAYGFYPFPSISSSFLGKKINWKDVISLNSIKIFTNLNMKKDFSKNIFVRIKKIRFLNFCIDSLNIKFDWNNINQNFYFSLKNKKLSMKLLFNGYMNKKTGVWKGIIKQINIKHPFGIWMTENNPLIFYSFQKSINDDNFKELRKKNLFSSIIYNTKMLFIKLFFQKSISIKTNVFINTKFQWQLGKKISNIKLALKTQNIKLEKKIKDNVLHEKIENFNLFVNFKKNNFMTQWIINRSKNKLKMNRISGFLNVYDIYHTQRIKGQFFLSNFSFSVLNIFTNNLKKFQGKFTGNIELLGNLYQPKILADIDFQNIYIKSDHILKYILLCFHFFSKKLENVKIDQEIIIKKGDILFELNSNIKNNISNFQWNFLFNSNNVILVFLPEIEFSFSSHLNLIYSLFKYNLIGYLNSSLFSFKINEKNFLF